MFSWLRLGRKKSPSPPPAAPPELPATGVDFADIFGAAAAAAPARQAESVSLDVPGEAPPSAPARETPGLPPRELAENLLRAQKYEEAGDLLDRLGGEYAGLEWFAAATLEIAQHRRHHPAALEAARALIAAAPSNPAGPIGASFALRLLNRPAEAETLIAAAIATAGHSTPTLWIEAAQAAEANGQTDLALTRWAVVRSLLPDQPAGWQGAVRLAARRQMAEPLEALLPEGLAKFPQDTILLTLAARHASRLQLWTQAASHWQALVHLHPQDPSVALEAVTAMMGPPAQRRQRVPALLPALATLRETFPDYAPAAAAHVSALREAGRAEDAASLAQTLRIIFPGDVKLALAGAGAAEDLARPAEVVDILQAARTGAPANWQLEAAFIRALALYGRDEQAGEVCAAALQTFPGNIGIVQQHVTLASRRGDFAEAVQRAEHWRAAYPANPQIARLASRMHALQDATPAPPAEANTPALAALFARFESMGATEAGCEFGIVQRQFGADPLGLLRWGNMRIEGLTKALHDRFEGVGDEAHTKIKAQPVAANSLEYFVYDDRYHYWAHTFIKADEAPMEQVYQQTLRRLRFLRGKLIEDLEQSDKIFVFKLHVFEGVEPLLGMFDALRVYGPNTLLCVALADAAHPAGSVEMLQPGFFIGRVGMFGNAGLTEARGIDLPAWRSVCAAVAKWRDEEKK